MSRTAISVVRPIDPELMLKDDEVGWARWDRAWPRVYRRHDFGRKRNPLWWRNSHDRKATVGAAVERQGLDQGSIECREPTSCRGIRTYKRDRRISPHRQPP